jgi:fatty acid desaturase
MRAAWAARLARLLAFLPLAAFPARAPGLAARLAPLVGLAVFFALVEAEPAVRGCASLLVCPAIGVTTIRAESRQARQHASSGAEIGEFATLISPL